MFNRYIKELFFNFRISTHITNHNAKSVFIFEESLTSKYLDWFSQVLPEQVDLIELKKNLSFPSKETNLSSIQKLLKYERIFFHSPGEVLQNKCLQMLEYNDFKGLTIGVQHGFIGENKPRALDYIISRCKSQFFLSFETKFSECLESNNDNLKIIEYLFTKPKLKPIYEMPKFFECYFDATDKKSIKKDINQIKIFLEKTATKLTKLIFHPATPFYKKILIKFILRKHIISDKNINNNHAICWDSKVKYELADKGKNIYFLNDDNSLYKILYSREKNDFHSHVRFSLSDFINGHYLEK